MKINYESIYRQIQNGYAIKENYDDKKWELYTCCPRLV